MTIAQTIGRTVSAVEAQQKAAQFNELAIALMLGRNSPHEAARAMGASSAVLAVTKAAVGGTDFGDIADFHPMVQGFLTSLVNVSAFDSILQDAHRVPLHSRVGLVTANATGSSTAPFQAKPVGKLVVSNTPLTEQKATALVVASNEILQFGVGAAALIGASLRQSVATATDSVFAAALIAATTPIGSTGSGIDNVAADLKALLAAVPIDAGSRLHLIAGAAVVAQLAVLASTTGFAFPTVSAGGGSIAGIPIHVSDALTDEIVLVDASALAMAADQVRLRVSTQAALEMDTEPSSTALGGSPLAPTEANAVSMWQTDSTALLAERYFGFAIARASGIASLSGATWGGGGSP